MLDNIERTQIKSSPYWWEDAPRESSHDTCLPEKIDVAVIGAGYTGLSAALVLARAGLSISVFESGQLGEGASSRNGGMVGPSFHKLGLAGLNAQYGRTKTNEIIRESIGLVDFLENFIKTENIEADFARTGRFRGAFKPAHYDAMARQLESLQEACGLSGSMVPRSQQSSETGSQLFHGGMIYDSDGGLHPGKYHNGLASCVRQAGAVILTHTPVRKIQKIHGAFQLTTPRGVIKADRVAVCTNGYSAEQLPYFRARVLPMRSAMIATEELPLELMSLLMPKGRVYGDSRRIVAYYRPSPDGRRILFGSRATGLVDQPAKNVRMLQHSLVELFPQLAKTKISHVWSGLVAYTFDHAPHIGQHDGLDFAMGYCGSGVARATYFGQKLGYKILGQGEKGRTAFDDLSFQTKSFYTGNPWFMPLVLNWHRIADKLGI